MATRTVIGRCLTRLDFSRGRISTPHISICQPRLSSPQIGAVSQHTSSIIRVPKTRQSTLPSSFDGSEEDSSGYSETICEALEKDQKWGFTILRCTYDSQPDWEAFTKRFLEDIDANLRFEWEPILRQKFQFRVVEDPAKLSNANWRQARAYFTHLCAEDIRRSDPSISDPETELLRRTRDYTNGSECPYRDFFIFADRDSVGSIINCGRTWHDAYALGAYYFNLVHAQHKEVIALGDDGTKRHSCEHEHEYDKWAHQKFKVDEFHSLYAALLRDEWPRFPVRKDGISEVN